MNHKIIINNILDAITCLTPEIDSNLGFIAIFPNTIWWVFLHGLLARLTSIVKDLPV